MRANLASLTAQGPCDRCVKLGTECTIQPSRRGKGPRKKPPSSAQIETLNSTIELVLSHVPPEERASLILQLNKHKEGGGSLGGGSADADGLDDDYEDDETSPDGGVPVPVAGPSGAGPTFAPNWSPGPSNGSWPPAPPIAPPPTWAAPSLPQLSHTSPPAPATFAGSPHGAPATIRTVSESASPSVQLDTAPLEMLAEVSGAHRSSASVNGSSAVDHAASGGNGGRYEICSILDETTRRDLVHLFLTRMNSMSAQA